MLILIIESWYMAVTNILKPVMDEYYDCKILPNSLIDIMHSCGSRGYSPSQPRKSMIS